MKELSWIEQIEYLVNRKFPMSKAPPPSPMISSRVRHSNYQEEYQNHQNLLSKIKLYKHELLKLPQDELERLYKLEKSIEIEQIMLKEKKEEQARFFNLDSANADFVHWSNAVHWTLDEAIALSFGKSPDVVTWEKIKSYKQVSAFATEYAKRRDLAIRALSWKKLFDPMLPTIFISWAKELEIELPADLISNVDKRKGIAVNWFEEYQKIKVAYDELNNGATLTHEVAEKPLNNRERNSLYRIIAALTETLLTESSHDADKQYLKNQASLIVYLDTQYKGYEGLSKSNLEKVFPAAKNLLNLS